MIMIYTKKKYWVKSLTDLLDRLGFSEVWFFQGVGDINIFVSTAKQRIADMCVCSAYKCRIAVKCRRLRDLSQR